MFDTLSKLEKIRQRNPGVPLFARVAEECLKRGKVSRALELSREGCSQFPNYSTGFFVMSKCLEAEGELEEARAVLDKALRLDPDNPGGFVKLSDLYCQLGVDTLALKSIEHAASLDPFNANLAHRVEQLSKASATPVPEPPPSGDHAEPALESDGLLEEDGGTVGEAAARIDDDRLERATQSPEARDTDATDTSAGPVEVEGVFESSFDSVVDAQIELESGPTESETSPSRSDDAATSDTELDTEPFAAVEPLPEWEEMERVADEATAPEDQTPPVLPAGDVSSSDDEVAALGAELFGDEGADTGTGKSADRPDSLPAREEELTVTELDGDEIIGQAPDDEEIIGTIFEDDELIGALPQPDEVVEEPRDVSAAETAPPAAESERTDPVSIEGEDSAAAGLEEAAPVDDGFGQDSSPTVPPPPEPASPVSRLSASDDGELVGLFREIERWQEGPPAEPANGRDIQTSGTYAAAEEPVPTVTLAELYSQQGFAERAMVTYRQILTVQPDNDEVRSKLSTLERSW